MFRAVPGRSVSLKPRECNQSLARLSVQPAVTIRVNGQDIRLARLTSAKLYLWGGRLSLKTLEATSYEAAMSLPGDELGRAQGPSGDVSLAMIGFSMAYAELQKVCIAEANIGATPPSKSQDLTGTSTTSWPDRHRP